MSGRCLLQGQTYGATLVMGFKIAKVEFKGLHQRGVDYKGRKGQARRGTLPSYEIYYVQRTFNQLTLRRRVNKLQTKSRSH